MSESEDAPTPAKVQKLSSSVTEISSEGDPIVLDESTQKALEDIDSCQTEIDILNEKASEEILQVEMKYNKLRRPHFEKRNNLIKHIPNFWVTAFLNHPRMANIVEEEEEECLHYLRQVDVEEYEDIKSGYRILFTFADNPYFTDQTLIKEFYLSPLARGASGTHNDAPISTAVKVNWKPNMDLRTYSRGRVRKSRQGNSRSFFTWLSTRGDPTSDRVAEMIKDELWPNPLQYYLASTIEVEENGFSNSDDSGDSRDVEDDSVVIVGDDDDDDIDNDDDVYEVHSDDVEEDDNDVDSDDFDETVESIEVEDDDDDDEDAIHVLGSDSEAELEHGTSEVSQDQGLSHDGESSQQDSNLMVRDRDVEENVAADSLTADNSTSNLDSSVINVPDTSQDGEDVLGKDSNEDSNAPLEDNDGNDSDLLKDDDEDGGGTEGDTVGKKKDAADGTGNKDELSQESVLLGTEGKEEGVD